MRFECNEHVLRYVYPVTLYTDNIVNCDLDRSPVAIFRDHWVGISRKITCICEFWISQSTNFLPSATKLEIPYFKTVKNLKFVDWRLYEEMQPVVVDKNSSNTKKHHTCKIFGKIWVLNHLVQKKTVNWNLDGRNPDSHCFQGNRNSISRRIRLKFNFLLVWRIRFALQGTKCIVWR